MCVPITVHIISLDGVLLASCLGLILSSIFKEVDGGGIDELLILSRNYLVDRRFIRSWSRQPLDVDIFLERYLEMMPAVKPGNDTK